MELQTVETSEPVDSDDMTLVALTPADMGPAQTALSAWCDRKLTAVRQELLEIEANYSTLIESGMKGFGLLSVMRRTEKRVSYYEKIKAAVDAGYLLVPNFPIDVFAVRVTRARQARQSSSYVSSSAFEARPELLPADTGRYVDDRVTYHTETYYEPDREGKQITKTRYVSDEYDAVDFPFRMVKPSVLKATQHAMALRIFDRVGTVENRAGRDPIVVGQLVDPRGNGRFCTFFIAWWLDTATL